LFYVVFLANMVLAVVAVLYAKVTDSEFYTQWAWPRVSKLGTWSLQLATSVVVFSYMMTNFLYLRFCLFVACCCFIYYSITFSSGILLDLLFFNVIMALLNIRHAVTLLYERRYVEFTPELNQVYVEVFSEFMRRTDFQKLANVALLRRDKANLLLKGRGDLVTSLCVIVSGEVVVLNSKNVRVNQYSNNEFMEAPEWVESDLDPDGFRFRVGFKTVDQELIYLKWPRESLVRVLSGDPSLKSALRAVLGIQTAKLWLRSIEISHQEPLAYEQMGQRQRDGDRKFTQEKRTREAGEFETDESNSGPVLIINGDANDDPED